MVMWMGFPMLGSWKRPATCGRGAGCQPGPGTRAATAQPQPQPAPAFPCRGAPNALRLHTRQCTRVRPPVKVPTSLPHLHEGLPTQPQERRPCSAQNRAGKPPAVLRLSQHKASPHMGTSVRLWGAEMAGQASCELASSNSVKKNNIQIGMDKAFTIKS